MAKEQGRSVSQKMQVCAGATQQQANASKEKMSCSSSTPSTYTAGPASEHADEAHLKSRPTICSSTPDVCVHTTVVACAASAWSNASPKKSCAWYSACQLPCVWLSFGLAALTAPGLARQ